MSEFLRKDTNLKSLDLGYNRLEDDGAIMIAESLMMTNTNLERLSIKYNNIHSEGLCSFADTMKYNSTLSHIFIWGNHLEEPACIVIINNFIYIENHFFTGISPLWG